MRRLIALTLYVLGISNGLNGPNSARPDLGSGIDDARMKPQEETALEGLAFVNGCGDK